MRTVEEARLLHAEYYLTVIKRSQAIWTKDPLEALSIVTEEWTSINLAHEWLSATENSTPHIEDLLELYARYARPLADSILKPEQRVKWFAIALQTARKSGRRSRIRSYITNLAHAHRVAGNLDAAIELYIETLNMAKDADDRLGEWAGVYNIGLLYRNKGDFKQGLIHVARSLELSRQLNDPEKECLSLNLISDIYNRLGYTDKALETYQEALKSARSHGYLRMEAVIVNGIAGCFWENGDYQNASNAFREAIQAYRRCGDYSGVAVALSNLSVVVSETDPSAAVELSSEALTMNLLSPRTRGHIWCGAGRVYYSAGYYKRAENAFRYALECAHDSGDLNLRAMVLGRWGFLMIKQGDKEQGAELIEEKCKIAHEFGDRLQEAWALDQLSKYHFTKGELSVAISQAKSAICLYSEIKNMENLKRVEDRLCEWNVKCKGDEVRKPLAEWR